MQCLNCIILRNHYPPQYRAPQRGENPKGNSHLPGLMSIRFSTNIVVIFIILRNIEVNFFCLDGAHKK